MTDHEAAWLAHQRARWMRPDAHRWMCPDAERWIRPDAARFLKPGTNLAEVFPAPARKYSPNQPRIPAGQPGGGRWTDEGNDIPDFATGGGGAESLPVFPDPGSNAQDSVLAFNNEDTPVESLTWPLVDDEAPKPIPNASADDIPANVEDVGGGNTGRRAGSSVGDAFPSASARQQSLLDQALIRSGNALAQIRQYDPEWKPSETSLTQPGSVEGAIAEAEARATESEARLEELRSGIGGNLGPPLDPPRQGLPSMRPFDGQGWINAYRTIYNAPNLFGEPAWSQDNGTVAASVIDGKLYFGVNSGSPGYSASDRFEADGQRWGLANKYPGVMAVDNIGQWPNDSLYHAEATILMRAAKEGSLTNKAFEIHVDRELCRSCDRVLPLLGLELGNPTVTFTNAANGARSTMRDGYWLP